MRKVAQEHPMGCGIACIASVAGVSYSKALQKTKRELAWTRGYYCKELADALAKLGQKYTYKKVTDKNKNLLQIEGAIVFVARSKKYLEGHYLLRHKQGWMNPWINYPDINPAKAGYQKRLPGKVQWILIPSENS